MRVSASERVAPEPELMSAFDPLRTLALHPFAADALSGRDCIGGNAATASRGSRRRSLTSVGDRALVRNQDPQESQGSTGSIPLCEHRSRLQCVDTPYDPQLRSLPHRSKL